MNESAFRRALGLVTLFALALRIVNVLTIRDYPLFEVLALDAESYDTWARRIAAGEWMRGRPFYQAPLYAYFLAGIHAVSGGDPLAPRVVNAFLGAAHVALVGLLGRRAFGGAAGLAAAALVALHATFLFEEAKVTKTTLGLVLASGALLVLVEARRRKERAGHESGEEGTAPDQGRKRKRERDRGRDLLFLAAGFLSGLTALVRENFLLFAAAASLWVAWRWRRESFVPAGLLAGGAALALLPSTAHNVVYDGEILPITAQAGQNFYTGVHAGNPWGGYLVPEFVRRSPRFEEIDFAREAERRFGRPLTAGGVSRFWMREAFAELRGDPLRLPVLFARKLGLLYHDHEIPDDEDIRFFRRWAPVLRLPLPGFGLFGILGILGVALALRSGRAPPELVLFLAVYSASVALFFVFSRYRLPLVSVLAVFAGHAIVAGAGALRAGRIRPVALGVIAAVPLALLVYRPLGIDASLANSHLSAGIGYEVAGRAEDALREYEAGLALEPWSAKLLRRRALLLAGVAELAAARGTPAGARPPRGRAAAALPATALLEEAREALAEAVVANPDDPELRFRLGTTLGTLGRFDEAGRELEEVLRRGHEPPGVHANLAIAYDALGRVELARRHARRALETAPADATMRAIADRPLPGRAE